MTLVQRIYVSGLLTPPLLWVFFGLFACSPLLTIVGPIKGFGLSLLAAFFGGYCIVLAACVWRDANA